MWCDCPSFKLYANLISIFARVSNLFILWQCIQVITSIDIQTTVPVGLVGMTSDLRSPSPSAVLRAVRTAWGRPPWLAWTWTIFFWGRSAAGVTKFLLYDKVLGPATRRRNLLSGISHCKIYGTLRCVMRCILNSAKRNQSLMKSYILFKIAK